MMERWEHPHDAVPAASQGAGGWPPLDAVAWRYGHMVASGAMPEALRVDRAWDGVGVARGCAHFYGGRRAAERTRLRGSPTALPVAGGAPATAVDVGAPALSWSAVFLGHQSWSGPGVWRPWAGGAARRSHAPLPRREGLVPRSAWHDSPAHPRCRVSHGRGV